MVAQGKIHTWLLPCQSILGDQISGVDISIVYLASIAWVSCVIGRRLTTAGMRVKLINCQGSASVIKQVTSKN
jgi:hypothetical protein